MDNIPFQAGKRGQAPDTSAFTQSVAEVERRLRALEERYANIERRSQVNEENMLSSDRKIKSEIKLLAGEVSEMKSHAAEISEKMRALISEMEGFARREEVDVIRKYLNLIEPLGFVTQNEMQRAVKQAVEDALGEHAETKEQE